MALTVAFVEQGLSCGWGNIDTACRDPNYVATMPLPPFLGLPIALAATAILVVDVRRSFRGEDGEGGDR